MHSTDTFELAVGVVGLGAAARTLHLPLIAATPGLRLAAVVTTRPDALPPGMHDVRVVDSVAALCAEGRLDVVVIASPPDSHARHAVTALESGHHVVVEKPFTLDLADARLVARTAQRCERQVTVFQNRRFDSCFRSVRREIAGGAIGRVTHYESRFDRHRPEVRVRWREAAGPAGGIWADLGSHLVDQTLLLFGKPEAVTGLNARHRDDAMTDDWAHVVLHYPGLEAVLHATLLAARAEPRFVLHGTDGSLRKVGGDPQEDRLRAGLRPTDAGFGADPDPVEVTVAGQAPVRRTAEPGDYAQFYRLLRDALLGQGSLPVSVAEALATAEVLEAVRRSLRERRTIML